MGMPFGATSEDIGGIILGLFKGNVVGVVLILSAYKFIGELK